MRKINSVVIVLLVALSYQHSIKSIKHKNYGVQFVKTKYSEMHGWQYDNHLISLKTFDKSCKKIKHLKGEENISLTTSIGGQANHWQKICKHLDFTDIKTNKQARFFFEKWFLPYKILDEKGFKKGKGTGYYEITLNGSLIHNLNYPYPVYGPPKNLESIKKQRNISHSAINNGSLKGLNLEIIWVNNLAKLHWMQIQGSGIIKLDNNNILRLGYAGQNGFEYTSVGPYFKKYGATGIKSALDMIKWIHDHPIEGKKIIEKNESYIFFKKIYSDGPIGTQGTQLTAERSIAIDHSLYPFGMPIWVESSLPYSKNYIQRDYRRLFIAQDKGGAIKGAIRGDIFFGSGKRAEELACYMNNDTEFTIMLPKSVRVPKIYRSFR